MQISNWGTCMGLVGTTMSRRLGLAPLVHTRAISWGARFSHDPVSSPQTTKMNTLYKPIRPPSDSEDYHPVRREREDPRSTQPRVHPPRPARRPAPTPPEYLAHRAKMKRMFPEGWSPPRTISREAMDTLRDMHARDPVQFRTPVLAAKFKISPEAVSRILKSKWRPSSERKSEMITRENKEKDMAISERMRVEREEAEKSLKGRPVLMESEQRRRR